MRFLSIKIKTNSPPSLEQRRPATQLTLTIYDTGLPAGKQAVTYTTLAADTLTTIAAGVAACSECKYKFAKQWYHCTSSAAVVTLQSKSPNLTSYRQSFNSTATESMLISPAKFGCEVVALGGTKTTGNTVTVVIYDIGLATGSKAISYTVVAADTLTTIATNLAAAINADATLTALGVTATASSAVVSLKSLSPNLTTYVTSTSAGATETLALGAGMGLMQSFYNNVNELKSIAAGGPALSRETRINQSLLPFWLRQSLIFGPVCQPRLQVSQRGPIKLPPKR